MRKYLVLTTVVTFCLIMLLPIAWAGGTFVWPVNGEVIMGFSPGEHRGIDISAHVGDSVLAAQEGIVYWIGKTPRGEPCISIDHPNGLTTTYLPVAASICKGQSVSAGEKIGVLSAEGDVSSGAPHLHFGLFNTATRDSKVYLNPADYLPPGNVQQESNGEAVTAPEAIAPGSGVGQLPSTQPLGEASPATGVAVGGAVSQETIVASNATGDLMSSNPVQSSPTGNSVADSGITMRNGAKQEGSPTALTNSQQGYASDISSHAPSPLGSSRAATVGSNAGEQASASKTGTNNDTRARAGAQIGNEVSSVSNKRQKQAAHIAGLELGLTGATNGMLVRAKRSNINPFSLPAKNSLPANPADQHQVRINSAAHRPWDLLMHRVFMWRFLPDATSVLLIIVIAVLSVQFMRKARKVEAATLAELGYCGRF